MELVLWSAARRLAFLVVGALAMVSVAFVRDARIGLLPAVSEGIAVSLVLLALPPLLRAKRLVREAHRAPPRVPSPSMVYRASAAAEGRDALERAATRQAASAFMLLALAGTLVIVAAAAR